MTRRLALLAITFAVLAAPGTASAEVTDWNRPSCCAAESAASAPLWEVVVVVVVAFVVGMFALGTVRSEGPEERGDNDGNGPRGPGPESPQPGGAGPPTGEPDWWPDFERQLAAYVEHRDARTLRSPTVSRHEPRAAGCLSLHRGVSAPSSSARGRPLLITQTHGRVAGERAASRSIVQTNSGTGAAIAPGAAEKYGHQGN